MNHLNDYFAFISTTLLIRFLGTGNRFGKGKKGNEKSVGTSTSHCFGGWGG